MIIELTILFVILIALAIDVLFGEFPSRIHPVVWIGKSIDFLKDYLIGYRNRISGLILTVVLIMIFTLATYVIISLSVINYFIYIFISGIILTTTFAIKSLIKSAQGIKNDLDHDIYIARKSMSYLVSRDTEDLSSEKIVSATVETLTENITDSVTAPLFYTFIFGVPGAVAYRIVNTLDAMVGYKKPETIKIGWFPAKFDDILNYIPSRITGILVVIAALLLRMDWKNSYKILRRDARKPDSPNSGYTMAAAAGALQVKLEKTGYYQIGDSISPLKPDKISDAVLLTEITIILFLIFSFVLYGFIVYLI